MLVKLSFIFFLVGCSSATLHSDASGVAQYTKYSVSQGAVPAGSITRVTASHFALKRGSTMYPPGWLSSIGLRTTLARPSTHLPQSHRPYHLELIHSIVEHRAS